MAEIIPLPNMQWSPQAAAMDAANRVDKDAKCFVAIWVKADGEFSYSKYTTDTASFCLASTALQEMSIAWIRQGLENAK